MVVVSRHLRLRGRPSKGRRAHLQKMDLGPHLPLVPVAVHRQNPPRRCALAAEQARERILGPALLRLAGQAGGEVGKGGVVQDW